MTGHRVRGLAAFRGSQARTQFAEGFEQVRLQLSVNSGDDRPEVSAVTAEAEEARRRLPADLVPEPMAGMRALTAITARWASTGRRAAP
jgi:hypothetical protein